MSEKPNRSHPGTARINNPERGSGSSRGLMIGIIVMLIIAGLITFFIESSKKPKIPDGVMSVRFIDIGQGDAALFITTDTAVLIDAGPGDSADKLISEIEKTGIKSLDCAIFTHPHEDHIGGAAKVINLYKPKEVVLPDAETDTKVFESMLKAIDDNNIKMKIAADGDELRYGDIIMKVLSPEKGKTFTEDLNRSTLIIKVSYGETMFMMCGDAEYQEENAVLEKYGSALDSDVLKVSHHGSSGGSSFDFLKAVSPDYAIISCGKDNSYGHPHKSVLDKLKKVEAEIFRTDNNGTVTVETDGKTVSVRKEKG